MTLEITTQQDLDNAVATLNTRITTLETTLNTRITQTMSALDNLTQQVAAAAGDEAALKQTITTALANIQTEIDTLKSQIPDATVLDTLTQQVTDLDTALKADTSQVAAADPGTPTP